MSEKILKLQKLPSGVTALALQTKAGFGIEVGSCSIFLEVEDLPDFLKLVKAVDLHFLRRP